MPGGSHHQIGEQFAIEPPNAVKIMADGKYDMKVRAIQRSGPASFQPQLCVGCPALRASSMFARIVDNFLIVAPGTGIDMVALLLAAAGHDAPGSVLFSGV